MTFGNRWTEAIPSGPHSFILIISDVHIVFPFRSAPALELEDSKLAISHGQREEQHGRERAVSG